MKHLVQFFVCLCGASFAKFFNEQEQLVVDTGCAQGNGLRANEFPSHFPAFQCVSGDHTVTVVWA